MRGQIPGGSEAACAEPVRRWKAPKARPTKAKRWFGKEEIARIRRDYPTTPTGQLAAELGRSACSIQVLASKLGVRKSVSLVKQLARDAAAKPRTKRDAEPTPRPRRQVEHETRAQLQRERDAALGQIDSLVSGLTDQERLDIRERVRRGLWGQAGWPRAPRATSEGRR